MNDEHLGLSVVQVYNPGSILFYITSMKCSLQNYAHYLKNKIKGIAYT